MSALRKCFSIVETFRSCDADLVEYVFSHHRSSSPNKPPPSDAGNGSSPNRWRSWLKPSSSARRFASVLLRAVHAFAFHCPRLLRYPMYHLSPRLQTYAMPTSPFVRG
jgi:hypothetical protein